MKSSNHFLWIKNICRKPKLWKILGRNNFLCAFSVIIDVCRFAFSFKPSDISSYIIEPHHFLPLMNQDFVKISRISKRAALLRENAIVDEVCIFQILTFSEKKLCNIIILSPKKLWYNTFLKSMIN